MNKHFSLWVAVLMLTLGANAQQRDTAKYAFSLQQAVDYALNNNTRAQNASLDEAIAQNKVKEVFGMGLPQINAAFSLTDMEKIQTMFVPANAFNPMAPRDVIAPLAFGVQYTSSASISASQLIFSNSFFIGLDAAKTYQQLAQKAAARTKIESAQSVSKAYYSVLVAQERLKLLDANVTRLKKLMDDTKALNENGFVEKIDLDRITLIFNSIVTEKEKAERLSGLSLALLKYQMGLDQKADLTLTDQIASIVFQPEALVEKINYSSRIEYSISEAQKRAAYLQHKTNRQGYLPTLVAFANVGTNTGGIKFDLFNSDKTWYNFAILGLNLNMPIFNGLQRHYKTQQSKLGMQKAENDLKFVQQSIDLEVANTSVQLQNAVVSLETQKKNIVLAEDIYKVSKLKYDQGVGSNLEVLTAETALKEAQTNYFGALYDALIAKVDYQKSIGTLIK
jgi:outer membrane protein TolC